VRALEA